MPVATTSGGKPSAATVSVSMVNQPVTPAVAIEPNTGTAMIIRYCTGPSWMPKRFAMNIEPTAG